MQEAAAPGRRQGRRGAPGAASAKGHQTAVCAAHHRARAGGEVSALPVQPPGPLPTQDLLACVCPLHRGLGREPTCCCVHDSRQACAHSSRPRPWAHVACERSSCCVAHSCVVQLARTYCTAGAHECPAPSVPLCSGRAPLVAMLCLLCVLSQLRPGRLAPCRERLARKDAEKEEVRRERDRSRWGPALHAGRAPRVARLAR